MRAIDSRWDAGWAPLVVAAVYVALLGLANTLARQSGTFPTLCWFKLVTGLPCATCGATRMVFALAAGHFAEAWRLNPLLMCAAVVAAPWLVLRYVVGYRLVIVLSPPARRTALALLGLAVVSNWAYLIVAGR